MASGSGAANSAVLFCVRLVEADEAAQCEVRIAGDVLVHELKEAARDLAELQALFDAERAALVVVVGIQGAGMVLAGAKGRAGHGGFLLLRFRWKKCGAAAPRGSGRAAPALYSFVDSGASSAHTFSVHTPLLPLPQIPS